MTAESDLANGPLKALPRRFLEELARLNQEAWSVVRRVPPEIGRREQGYEAASTLARQAVRRHEGPSHDELEATLAFAALPDVFVGMKAENAAYALVAKDLIPAASFAVLWAPFADILPIDVLAIADPADRAAGLGQLSHNLSHAWAELRKHRGIPPFHADRSASWDTGAVPERIRAQHFVGDLVIMTALEWLAVARAASASSREGGRDPSEVWNQVERKSVNYRTPNCAFIEVLARDQVQASLSRLTDSDREAIATTLGARTPAVARSRLAEMAARASVALFVQDLVDDNSFDILYRPFAGVRPVGILGERLD